MPVNLVPESSGKSPRPGQLLRLASLAPRFDEARHRLYYDLLVRAIDADGTHNVALTGAYGTGKSSILDQLHRDRKGDVIQLSLSTIAPGLPDAGADMEGAATEGVTTRTNQIQKEIVKQLLYRLPVRSVPRTRFRRTTAPDRRREWIIAAVAGLLILGLMLSLGLAQPLVDGLFEVPWRRAIAYLVLAGIAVGGAWLVGRLLGGRPTMSASVNAGPATVSLSKASGTYFDEYLDEIVYFFQVSKPKVVVIEDIDRFEDVQVFDTLRALNGLLNNSAQIDSRIVFVYAIRDSVFEQIGAAENDHMRDAAKATLERASRTKFFDVIIPVVPFVSADNARDVMSTAMRSDSFAIDPALIRLAARHVADMRTIYNIRNEFEVYRSRLVVPDESGEDKRVPGITDDLVFAIILFKNTHLADFEKFRQQDSTLDHLYAKWRALVGENLAERMKKLRELRRALHYERTASARADELGRNLTAFVELLQSAAETASRGATVALSGVGTAENVGSRATWEAIASGENQMVTISALVPAYGRVGASTLAFSAEQLTKLLGTTIDPAEWEQVDTVDLEHQISRIEGEMEFLRHHTWADLCRHPEFVVATRPTPGADESLAGQKVSFDHLVQNLLKSDLARDLVRHGFLTSHFALYASNYYGEHLGPDAMEYIRRCIEPGTPDASFALEPQDVNQILREQGAGTSDTADIFSDASVFNVSIIDYLLEERPRAATIVASRLSQMGGNEQAFLDVYVGQGKHPDALLAAMTPTWRGVLRYAAGNPSVEAAAKPSIIDACLRALPDGDYEVDEHVRQLLKTSYTHITSITRPESAERAQVVFSLVRKSGAIIASVSPLNQEALDVVIDMRLYPITEMNLSELAPGETIALDDLQVDDRVYRHAVDRLRDYLAAFQMSPATAHTVNDPTSFESILTDAVAASDSTSLGQLIAFASEGCRVASLGDVPADAWPFLVDEGRTDPTFENTKLYVNKFGLDEHLGPLLAGHGTITSSADVPTADRVQLAMEILNSRKVLPDAATRVGLAASLHPGEISPSSIEPEPGTLIGRLVKAGLLADDAPSFTRELMVDWATYEASIAASTRFASFVSPDLVSVSQIPALLRSKVVGKDVKVAVVTHLADYLVGPSVSTINAVVSALNDGGWKLRYPRIEALRAAGASHQGLIKLMAREADELSIEHLKALLREMGGEYFKAATGGRGRPTFEDDQAHRDVLGRLVNHTISRVERESFKGKGPRLVTPLINPRS